MASASSLIGSMSDSPRIPGSSPSTILNPDCAGVNVIHLIRPENPELRAADPLRPRQLLVQLGEVVDHGGGGEVGLDLRPAGLAQAAGLRGFADQVADRPGQPDLVADR